MTKKHCDLGAFSSLKSRKRTRVLWTPRWIQKAYSVEGEARLILHIESHRTSSCPPHGFCALVPASWFLEIELFYPRQEKLLFIIEGSCPG